jgi:hypothetical protein
MVVKIIVNGFTLYIDSSTQEFEIDEFVANVNNPQVNKDCILGIVELLKEFGL